MSPRRHWASRSPHWRISLPGSKWLSSPNGTESRWSTGRTLVRRPNRWMTAGRTMTSSFVADSRWAARWRRIRPPVLELRVVCRAQVRCRRGAPRLGGLLRHPPRQVGGFASDATAAITYRVEPGECLAGGDPLGSAAHSTDDCRLAGIVRTIRLGTRGNGRAKRAPALTRRPGRRYCLWVMRPSSRLARCGHSAASRCVPSDRPSGRPVRPRDSGRLRTAACGRL